MKNLKTKREVKVAVTDSNLRKAAARLLVRGGIVSTEISYIKRTLGNTATQTQIDEHVVLVRKLPWEKIAQAD